MLNRERPPKMSYERRISLPDPLHVSVKHLTQDQKDRLERAFWLWLDPSALEEIWCQQWPDEIQLVGDLPSKVKGDLLTDIARKLRMVIRSCGGDGNAEITIRGNRYVFFPLPREEKREPVGGPDQKPIPSWSENDTE